MQTRRSATYVHSGAYLTFVDCHENPWNAPQRTGHLGVFQRLPSELTKERDISVSLQRPGSYLQVLIAGATYGELEILLCNILETLKYRKSLLNKNMCSSNFI